MTWTCPKCGEHNSNDFPSNIDWTHPQVLKYVKRIDEAQMRGEDPYAKCKHCRYDRSLKH